jgi:hypothetical protein
MSLGQHSIDHCPRSCAAAAIPSGTADTPAQQVPASACGAPTHRAALVDMHVPPRHTHPHSTTCHLHWPAQRHCLPKIMCCSSRTGRGEWGRYTSAAMSASACDPLSLRGLHWASILSINPCHAQTQVLNALQEPCSSGQYYYIFHYYLLYYYLIIYLFIYLLLSILFP